MMVLPSIHYNLTDVIICNVKLSLRNIVSGWEPLGHSGTSRQYLKELSTNKNMTHIKKQVEAIIHPVVKSVFTSRYQSLTKIKLGARRSRGDTSQYNLVANFNFTNSVDFTTHLTLTPESIARTPLSTAIAEDTNLQERKRRMILENMVANATTTKPGINNAVTMTGTPITATLTSGSVAEHYSSGSVAEHDSGQTTLCTELVELD